MPALDMGDYLGQPENKDGDDQSMLLFSGPADAGRKRRSHMSVRYSTDEGETWSKPYLLDELGGAHSCLSVFGEGKDKRIGILYEGSHANMTFEVLTLDEIVEGTRRDSKPAAIGGHSSSDSARP